MHNKYARAIDHDVIVNSRRLYLPGVIIQGTFRRFEKLKRWLPEINFTLNQVVVFLFDLSVFYLFLFTILEQCW